MSIKPIPSSWITPVLRILEHGDRNEIDWSHSKAFTPWNQLGFFEHEAYPLLIQTLSHPAVLGQQVIGLRDGWDRQHCECYAFLCPHPWGHPLPPLYVKLGLRHTHLHINLFSLHPDDGTRKLQDAIAAYLKKNQP